MEDKPTRSTENSSTSNAEQIRSPAYSLAALDQDFLLGDSMRGMRFMLEYAKAEEYLRSWGALHHRRLWFCAGARGRT